MSSASKYIKGDNSSPNNDFTKKGLTLKPNNEVQIVSKHYSEILNGVITRDLNTH